MINKKGFTLIEMLVVIGIIGLLSAVVVIGLSGARASARDSRRIADINQVQNWLEVNYTPGAGYPAALAAPAPLVDPTGATYVYAQPAGAHTYRIGVCLERDAFGTGITNCPGGLTCSVDYFCAAVED